MQHVEKTSLLENMVCKINLKNLFSGLNTNEDFNPSHRISDGHLSSYFKVTENSHLVCGFSLL